MCIAQPKRPDNVSEEDYTTHTPNRKVLGYGKTARCPECGRVGLVYSFDIRRKTDVRFYHYMLVVNGLIVDQDYCIGEL